MAGQQAASTRRTTGSTESTVTEPAPARAGRVAPAKAAKAAPVKASKAAATKSAATKAAPAATRTAATRTAATRTAPASKTSARVAARVSLPVREDEKPWTAAELKAVKGEIESDMDRLRNEIQQAETELVGLMRDSGDGAGDDQADAGTKTYEREQEMSVAANAREMFLQNEHALERIADGSYGLCESCAKPIGKLRLQAAPRATLCLDCKKKQERR